MAIRWIHPAVDEDGEKLDFRLMSLKDIWEVIYDKDKSVTYADIAYKYQQKGFVPVALDDKQIQYYAVQVVKNGSVERYLFMTGEEFFSDIYQPFGRDEMVIHSPVVFPIGRVQKKVLLQMATKKKR